MADPRAEDAKATNDVPATLPVAEVAATPAASPLTQASAPIAPAIETAVAKPAPQPAAIQPAPAKRTSRKPVAKARSAAAPVVPAAKVTKPKTPIKAKPAIKAPKPAAPGLSQLKDKIMATKTTDFQNTDFTAALTGVVADAQAKAKAAFEQGTTALGEAGEFAKGNVEACVESGKILTEGLKDFGSALVSEGKAAIETLTADAKELAALKSPNDFLKLQGELMRRNFDSMVAFGSKNTEAMMKLASDVSSPLSSRVSLAVEKFKTAV